MKPKFYLTTPIYYVNGAPHIGHAYTSIAADVLARFKRLDGYDVFFLTGTDEHGQKVEKAAARSAGLDPQSFVDQVVARFRRHGREAWACPTMISSAPRSRGTSAPARRCGAGWTAAGMIYLGAYEGWYAVRDEAFYDESELTTRPDGSTRGARPARRWSGCSEPSYFFDLSQWQDQLLRILRSASRTSSPRRTPQRDAQLRARRAERSVDQPHQVHLGHSGAGRRPACDVCLAGRADELPHRHRLSRRSSAARWAFWPADLHLVGKDIIRFHAVYWPAFLMAAGLPLPKRVSSQGWWTVEGEKMSKSLGNVIEPRQLVRDLRARPGALLPAARNAVRR